MKRILIMALCVSLLLGGCGEKKPYVPTGDGLSGDEVAIPTGPTITEDELTLAYFPDRSLDPLASSDQTNRALFDLVYQSLFAVNAQYQAVPILCERFAVSPDMKTYLFYPASATFSDGSALTAQDVASSLRAAKESGYYAGRLGRMEAVTVTEEGAVKVELSIPYEHFELLLDIPIVKASQVGTERPLGTGPYAFQSRDGKLSLQRRAQWWCTADLTVTAQQILLIEGENVAQLRDEFEFSDLSMVCADPGSTSYVDFHSDHELWDRESGIFLYLGCNMDSKILSDPAIRTALTHAMDRSSFVGKYYRVFANPADLPASPQSPWYSASLAAKVDYAPQKLKDAVTAAALEDDHLVLLLNTEDGVRLRVGRDIAQALNGCGLRVTTSELDGASYREALKAGKFDLYLGQTKLSPNMDLSSFFAADGALNYGDIDDKATYALCQEALANSGNYYTLYQKILDDAPIVPILLRSYAIFTQRGSFQELYPARDHIFFYTLGRTLADIQTEYVAEE